MTSPWLLSHVDNGFGLEAGFGGLIGLAVDNRIKGYISPRIAIGRETGPYNRGCVQRNSSHGDKMRRLSVTFEDSTFEDCKDYILIENT